MSHTAGRQLDPGEILDADRFMDYERGVKRSRLVAALLGVLDRPGMELCDVGGATGVFLNEILAKSPHPIRGTILEVNEKYRSHVVRPEFEFLCTSIVDNQVPDDTFDAVTFRHVLHHLVADSVPETLALQENALSELLRITRPGGYVIFEEQVHWVQPFSRAVYHLSKLANRYRIRWRFFETGTVVISFLTPAELAAMVARHRDAGRLTVCYEQCTRRRVRWRWRLTVLMSRVGDALYVLRKER